LKHIEILAVKKTAHCHVVSVFRRQIFQKLSLLELVSYALVVWISLSDEQVDVLNKVHDYLIMELNLFKASLSEKDLIGFIWRLVELTLFWIFFFVLGNYTTVLL
jgi:hypothetical protein